MGLTSPLGVGDALLYPSDPVHAMARDLSRASPRITRWNHDRAGHIAADLVVFRFGLTDVTRAITLVFLHPVLTALLGTPLSIDVCHD